MLFAHPHASILHHPFLKSFKYLLLFLVCLFSYQSSQAKTESTSFEFNIDGTFNVGSSPFIATFTDGVAETRGNPELYVSGLNAWHVRSGVNATASFETLPHELSFFVRNDNSSVSSEVRIIDADGLTLQTIAVTNSYQQVSISRVDDESLLARIEFDNMGGGDIVVDVFTYTADEPLPVFDSSNPIPEIITNGAVTIELTDIATGLVSPVWGTFSPVDTTRLFVVDQVGILYAINLNSMAVSSFLDLSSRLVTLGAFGPDSFDERGFLGFAFHPSYGTNGLIYTYTSEPNTSSADFSTLTVGQTANHQSVITEWQVPLPSDPTSIVDITTARELLRIDQPQFNHNGGALNFDNNGYLLISLGDGGNADDEGDGHGTSGNGQDTSNPLGTLLRIDPLGSDASNGNYGIPSSNPFFGGSEVQEIFAYGLRNPFRFSIDSSTGDIWLADVGQNHIEEINKITAGGNYGWNHKEGSFFFQGNASSDGSVSDQDPGAPLGLIDPVAEYDHDEGIAIVGGFVYRGSLLPELFGRYVFGDFGSFSADAGKLFYLSSTNEILAFDLSLPFGVLGFAQDADGEIYILSNTTGTPFGTTGKVMRVEPVGSNTSPDNDDTNIVSTSDSSGGGCFIATAAYGSILHPYVQDLRKYRDQYLLSNAIGRKFVELYYRYSPPLADYIAEHEWRRVVARVVLAPLVFTVSFPLSSLLVIICLVLLYFVRRRLAK